MTCVKSLHKSKNDDLVKNLFYMVFSIKGGRFQNVSKILIDLRVVTNITRNESIILCFILTSNEIALTVMNDLADELEETFVN